MKRNTVILILAALLIGLILLGLPSCKKEPIYKMAPTQDTIANWDAGYSNGGTLSTGNSINNQLVGTKWVLTKLQKNYIWSTPNDTIEFIDNTNYKFTYGPGGPVITTTSGKYNLYQTNNGKALSLYDFPSFGGGYYYSTQGNSFISSGTFSNPFHEQGSNTQIGVVFIRIL